MLTRLEVKNFALLKDTEISFHPGFTVLTGETGAGKSLLVGAISFLIGGKTPSGIVRDGARTAIVEAEFHYEGSSEKLIIRRELDSSGRSRAFIQDSPVNLKQLALQTVDLVDITAQRSFSHLLDPLRHLDFVDQYSGLLKKRELMRQFASEYSSLTNKLGKLYQRRHQFLQQQEFISFQLSEIKDIDPQPDEDRELEIEIRKLENYEEFHLSSERLELLFSQDENSVEDRLTEASTILEGLSSIDPEFTELLKDFYSAKDTLKEIGYRVSQKHRHLEFDADKLEKFRERQHQLAGLVKKYGGSLAELLVRRQRLESELSSGDDDHKNIREMETDREKIVKGWCDLAKLVSEARHESAKRLEKKVETALTDLGLKNGQFKVNFRKNPNNEGLYDDEDGKWRLTDRGVEEAEFFLSTNPGLEPRPLAQVASGGELSRLLLTLKEVLPRTENEATIIFDEIDTGVSGRVAQLVGRKLKKLCANRQLLAITHLPQIAGLADNHLRVVKKPDKNSTETEIVELDESERIKELATLLSGGKVTEAALEQAENLIKEVSN